jgi:subtilisin family serine protease
MSFGSEDMDQDIRNAIIEALKRNVILLAAAGNSGNRRNIPYPASEDTVFKIFAAESSGYKAKFSAPTDKYNRDYCYSIIGCGVMSTWPSSLLEKAKRGGLEVFCFDNTDGHEHSEGGCDMRTVMSGTSFATPIAAALVAIIYQFYDANKSLESRVWLRNGSEDRFKSPKAVRTIFNKMSRTSVEAPYNSLSPETGNDNYFYFHPHKYHGPGKASPRNIDGQTSIQFFSKKLSQALYEANL